MEKVTGLPAVSEGEPFKIISLGDLVADIVLAIPSLPVEADCHQPARQITLEPGGAGNFLIAGARLGMEMIALGTIGDDPIGSTIVDILAREKSDTHLIVRQPGTGSTTVIVLVDEAGGHVFLGGYGTGPDLELPEAWVESILQAQALFASGYTLQERRMAKASLEAISLAHRTGIPVFFDPGPEIVHASAEEINAVLANSDAILLTEEEIPLMIRGEAGLDAARQMLGYGPRLVCVKRGARGCVLLNESETIEHPGYPVQVRDTTGAGDSFAAAFIYGYLKNWPLSQIAAFANAMGAAKVQKIGSGTKVPFRSEVLAVLEEYQTKMDI